MSIDWFTFTAQILNFLLLIWLLKRFLYGPITAAMAEREAGIAARFDDAARARSEAEETTREFQQQTADLASTRETLVAEAVRDVNAWREQQLHDARAEVQQARQGWEAELARERAVLIRELQLNVVRHTMEVGRHVMQELSDGALESQLVNRFIRQLADADAAKMVSTAVDGSMPGRQPLVVESSHPLNESDQSRLQTALQQHIVGAADIEFHLNPDLVCGIEVRSPGCKLAWNIRETLAEVESDLLDAIDETLPATGSGPPATAERLHKSGEESV